MLEEHFKFFWRRSVLRTGCVEDLLTGIFKVNCTNKDLF